MATLPGLHVGLTLDSATFVAETRRVNASVERMSRDIARSNATVQRGFADVQRTASDLRRTLFGLGAAFVFREIISAATAMERIENTLRVATGSSEDAARAFTFVREEALRLGLDLRTAAEQFGSLSAAARGTALEGQATRDIFTAVAQAMTVLGRSSEQSEGALRAIEQMISKGNVSAEELRGQLGERLPGAFQIAARAMGVTTQELDKMLRTGEVTAAQMLPRLAAELQKTFGPESARAAQSLQASINRLNTALFDFLVQVGRGGLAEAITEFSQELIDASKGANNFAREIGAVLGDALRLVGNAAIFAAKNIDLIAAALSGLIAFKAATFFLQLAVAIGTATKAMLTFNAAILKNPIGLIATGIAAAVAALTFYRDEIVKIGDITFQVGNITTLVWTAVTEVVSGLITIVKQLAGALASLAALDFAGVVAAWQGAVTGFARVFDAPTKAFEEFRRVASQDVLAALDFSDVLQGATALGTALEGVVPAADAAGTSIGKTADSFAKLQEAVKDARLDEQLSNLPEHTQKLAETLRRAGVEFTVQGDQLEVHVGLGARINQSAVELLEIYKRQSQELFQRNKAAEQFKNIQDITAQVVERSKQAKRQADEDALREQERLAERQADLMLEPFRNAIQNVQNLMTDTFEEIFRGGIDSFKDLAGAIKDIFIRLAAEIATLMVIRPVLGSLPASLGGFAGAGGIAGPGGLAGLFGGTGFNAGITSGGQISGMTETLDAGTAGANWGGIFVSGALGALGGSVLAPLLFKNKGRSGIGGTFGGGAGAAAGFALTGGNPLGGVAGGLLGSLLGGGIGSLFGGDSEDTGALRFSTGRGSPFDLGRFGSLNISGENAFAGPLREIVTKFDQGVSEFLTARQEQMATQAVQALEQFEGRFPEADPSAGFLAVLQERARAVLEAILPDTADIEKIIGGVQDIDQLGQRVQVALQAVETFNELTGKTATPAQQLENALADVRRQFAELRPIARALGLDVNALAAAQHQALATTRQQFAIEQQRIALEKQALTLQLQSFTANNQLQRDLIAIRLQFIELGNAARAAGIPMALVTQAFRAAQAQARQADRERRQQAALARQQAAAARRAREIARRERIEANRQQRQEERLSLFSSLQRSASRGNPMAEFQLDMQELQIRFAEARKEARRLGISMELVNLARRNEQRVLREGFIAELQSGMDDLADRAADLRDRFQGLLDPLLAFRDELTLTGASPAATFEELQSRFFRAQGQALTGDIAAIQQLPELGRALVQAAEQFGASPLRTSTIETVQAAVDRVISRTETARDDAMRGLTAVTERVGRESIQTMVAEGRETRAVLVRIERQMERLNASGRRVA